MRRLAKILLFIALLWGVLTWYVERTGPLVSQDYGPSSTPWPVLIVFDPDPIYDLDHQVGTAMAEALANEGLEVKLRSVRAVEDEAPSRYALHVLIANTYNWAPGRSVMRYIDGSPALDKAPVVAITLGAGSTARAHRLHLEALRKKGATVIAERELWLLRPNDEARLDEPNVDVALDIARSIAKAVAARVVVDA